MWAAGAPRPARVASAAKPCRHWQMRMLCPTSTRLAVQLVGAFEIPWHIRNVGLAKWYACVPLRIWGKLRGR